jgi:hypothetical protein
MNRYEIVIKGRGSYHIRSTSPLNAIKLLQELWTYKVEFIPTDNKNATVCVKLLDGARKSVSYYAVNRCYDEKKVKPVSEKMPAFVWESKTDEDRNEVLYYTGIYGVDKRGRHFFYRGEILKRVGFRHNREGHGWVYDAGYAACTDASDVKTPMDKSRCLSCNTLNEAKAWVEKKFNEKWAKEHK